MKYFFVILALCSYANAKTISRIVDEPIFEVKLRCTIATECPMVPESDVVYLDKDDEYIDQDNNRIVVTEPGFFVKNERFIPISKTSKSPDENYYACEEGKNYVIDNSASEINLGDMDEAIFKDLSSNLGECTCLWVPEDVLKTLTPEPTPTETTDVPPSITIIIPPTNPGTSTPTPSWPFPTPIVLPPGGGGGTPPPVIIIVEPPPGPPPVEPPPTTPAPIPVPGLFNWINPFWWFSK